MLRTRVSSETLQEPKETSRVSCLRRLTLDNFSICQRSGRERKDLRRIVHVVVGSGCLWKLSCLVWQSDFLLLAPWCRHTLLMSCKIRFWCKWCLLTMNWQGNHCTVSCHAIWQETICALQKTGKTISRWTGLHHNQCHVYMNVITTRVTIAIIPL